MQTPNILKKTQSNESFCFVNTARRTELRRLKQKGVILSTRSSTKSNKLRDKDFCANYLQSFMETTRKHWKSGKFTSLVFQHVNVLKLKVWLKRCNISRMLCSLTRFCQMCLSICEEGNVLVYFDKCLQTNAFFLTLYKCVVRKCKITSYLLELDEYVLLERL